MKKYYPISISDLLWIDINDEYPEYYKTVSVRLYDGSEHKVWRASDGDNNLYTIQDTNNLINEKDIKQWKN